MSSPVVSCVRHLIEEYRRFLRSTYRLADPHLRQQFEQHVDQTDVLVKGPYVTLARDYTMGKTLSELLAGGLGHPDLTRLHWNFGSNPIYEHQERAFRLVEAQERNCVIKTGTGSGKTEAFLLPLLSGIMKLRDQGLPGTKAIVLYPMNALANDQLKRLRNIVRESGVQLTFAMYTGESESVAPSLGEPLAGNEIVSRSQIRQSPPDLILTNYKELEFMLIRNVDRAIFSPALRFLVLDEIHSYRGALATEIACLIRRLKSRCALQPGQMRCVGTSATVSEGVGGDEALARFVTDLFGESFTMGDIVGEILFPHQEPEDPYLPPFVHLNRGELMELPVEDPRKILELTQRITGRTPPQEGTLSEKVATLLKGNQLVAALKAACETPHSLAELAKVLIERFPEASVLKEDAVQTLIEAYLLVGSIGTEDDPPALRPKLHSFFHGVYDVGLCMNPSCRLLVRDGSDSCPQCHSIVRPIALCRTCGQDFAKVRFHDDPEKPPSPNDDFQSDENTGFITPRIFVEAAEMEEDAEDIPVEEPVRPRGRRRTAARARLEDRWVCRACGKIHEQRTDRCLNPECGSADAVTLQKVMRGKGSTCPVCNSTYTKGDILTLLRSGIASTNSLLATHHLDRLDGEDRKLLIFSDNRQEAAHQAGYMKDRHRLFAIRHAIERIVRDSGAPGIAMADLPQQLLVKFQEMGLASRRLTTDEREKWNLTLTFEAASEFCRSTHQRISLENLALVEVRYEFLNGLKADPDFVRACEEAGFTAERGIVLVRALLDRMRRDRAVAHPFFQEYLDPEQTKWLMVRDEPYSVAIPEHERRPVFFMLDRNECARNGVGGFKFNALVRDSPRGTAAIPRLLAREGMDEAMLDAWTRKIVALFQRYEILVPPVLLPPRVRSGIGNGRPLQIAPRVMRLRSAGNGFRCQRCQIWRPYRGSACYSTKCSGSGRDLKEEQADREQYYVRLYTQGAPRRMSVVEHTAQIGQDQRAQRETSFKENRMDVLVCSPTLELGVDIGLLLTVLLRNCPPTPANYIQRAGRAGRRLHIGFVSTFCGMGPHDRHCFEDPAWLVRGEFHPPTVRLDNSLIMARHIRSYVLENIEREFPNLMGDLLDDLYHPGKLELSSVVPLCEEIEGKGETLVSWALKTFGDGGLANREFIADVIRRIPQDVNRVLENWFLLVQRIHEEFLHYRRILADRRAKQKAEARDRAYRELTTDKQSAYVLNYLANEGLLPSYQFPTDTFSLEPGVGDTPTLRRPSWLALFEFAPGNMVYANGHKLKTIRAYFEGRNRAASGGLGGGLEASGRVRTFCFCSSCGYASEENRNTCPECGKAIGCAVDVAFIESFEAEQFTQITSAEEARERIYFQRREHLIETPQLFVEVYPYPFAHLEHCRHAKILVTNWGRRTSLETEGEKFQLCQICGKHRPASRSDREHRRWDEEHAGRCSGQVGEYVLGYEFFADALTLPVPGAVFAGFDSEGFARTLGTALVAGASELLEVESDEIAFFDHPAGSSGRELIFYETAPGGAGYLESLARQVPDWAKAAMKRLYEHDCFRACYRCLKSYRNQPFHKQLDKNLARDVLFQLASSELLSDPFQAQRGGGIKMTDQWLDQRAEEPTSGTVIEQRLLEAIRGGGRLPEPLAQREFRAASGALLTIADFAYEDQKIAIYCDGFASHKDKVASDAQKRNELQAQGWAVLTFWGKTILKYPERCEEQVWRLYQARSRI